VLQVLVFFTWVVRGVADIVSMWDAVERVTTYATAVPPETDIVSNDPFCKEKIGKWTGRVEEEEREEKEQGSDNAILKVNVGSEQVQLTDMDGHVSLVDMHLAKKMESWPTNVWREMFFLSGCPDQEIGLIYSYSLISS
jgi:hypothetical protein